MILNFWMWEYFTVILYIIHIGIIYYIALPNTKVKAVNHQKN